MKKIFLSVMFIVSLLFLVACNVKDKGDSEYVYNGKDREEVTHFDKDGNLLVPFDVAYQLEVDEASYDSHTALVKMKKYDLGRLQHKLYELGALEIEQNVNLGNEAWYLIKLQDDKKPKDFIKAARQVEGFIFVDYNYLHKTETVGSYNEVDIDDVLNNPRIGEQWYLDAFGVKDTWDYLEEQNMNSGGDSSVVVAVIDTGVDYNHKDLAANMWVNAREIPNNGIDDDGNGYIDDYYGINTIANNTEVLDDHGHGTHVAGIIAAANNKEGIVGIAYQTKIMAIKAGMSSGFFTQSSIAQAIIYAYENGADVINMSFGGSSLSLAVQDALSLAYTRSVLVAAAGNDGLPNELIPGWFGPVIPNYPAAVPYVIGVMSVGPSGLQSGFSNWDGYAYSNIEYEVYAPGEAILSTLPNDRYGAWSGTSMAAPYVSAVAALLRSKYTDREIYTNKFIMGQINGASKLEAWTFIPVQINVPMIVDSLSAFTTLPKPQINLNDYYLFDSKKLSSKNNGDGYVDAGEIIDVGVVIRNRWGMSKDTIVTIDTLTPGGVTDPYVEIIKGEYNFQGVGTYSTKDNLERNGSEIKGVEESLRIKLREDTPNDYVVKLNVNITYKNGLDEEDQTAYRNKDEYIIFNVRRGTILPSVVREDTTLTKDNFYILANTMTVLPGVTLTVEPGTQIQFWSNDPNDAYAENSMAYINVQGRMIVHGTEEEKIKIFPSELMNQFRVEIRESSAGFVSFDYVEISNPHLRITEARHTYFTKIYPNMPDYYRYLSEGKIHESYGGLELSINNVYQSIFYGMTGYYYYYKPQFYGNLYDSIIVQSTINFRSGVLENNVILNNYKEGEYDSIASTYYASSNGVSVNNITFDNYTGKTYIRLYSNSSKLPESWDKLAERLDAKVATFENVQTIERLFGNYYDLAYFSAKKINGNLTFDDGSVIGSDSNYPYHGYFNSNYKAHALPSQAVNYAYFEFTKENYISSFNVIDSNIYLDLEDNHQIQISQYDATNLIYESSDNYILTVDDNGLIKPNNIGQAKVIIYTEDFGFSTEITVNVSHQLSLEEVIVYPIDEIMDVNQAFQLEYELYPYNTTERKLIFESSNPSVASVNEHGYIITKDVGDVTIFIKNQQGDVLNEVNFKVSNKIKSLQFTRNKLQTTLANDDDIQLIINPIYGDKEDLVITSTNPEVAYFDGEKLVKVQNGYTLIEAYVKGTDLAAELYLEVVDEVISNEIDKVVATYSHVFVLSNNEIYAWGEYISIPRKITSNTEMKIVDFYAHDYTLILIDENGTTLMSYLSSNGTLNQTNSNFDFNQITNIKHIFRARYQDTYYLINDKDELFSIGNNYYGLIGDGTTTNVNVPYKLMNNVKEVYSTNYYTFILTKTNDLYRIGGSNNTGNKPTLIYRNIKQVYQFYHSVSFYDDQNYYNFGIYDYEPTITEYLYVNSESYQKFQMIIEGNTLYLGDGNRISPIEKEMIYTFESNIIDVKQSYRDMVVITENEIYMIGRNDYNMHLLNNTRSNTGISNIILKSGITTPNLQIENSNIYHSRLEDDSIVIEFNQEIFKDRNFTRIYVNNGSTGRSIPINTRIDGNKLIITSSSFVHGQYYYVVVQDYSVRNVNGKQNTYYSQSFNYYGIDRPIEVISPNVDDSKVFEQDKIEYKVKFNLVIMSNNFGNIHLLNEGNEVIDSITLSLVNNELIVRGTLLNGTYRLIIPEDAFANYHGRSSEALEFSFSVDKKLVYQTNSHENNLRKAIDEEIKLTFANDITLDVNGISILTSDGNLVEFDTEVIENQLIIKPTLVHGMNYQVVILENRIVDSLGLVNEKFEFRFETYQPIELLGQSILDQATNISTRQDFKFYFNYAQIGPAYQQIKLTEKTEQSVSINKSLNKGVLNVWSTGVLKQGTEYQLVIPENALIDENGIGNELIEVNFETYTNNRKAISREDIDEIIRKLYLSGYNTSFTGNAILNNFNLTNLDLWFRIQGQSTDSYTAINGVAGNFWGTIDLNLIQKHIIDFDIFPSLEDIIIGEFLTEAPETAFPFVVDVEVYNESGLKVDKVGNELITVKVHFNKDMETSIPLRVAFGSSAPYAERLIEGSYETPRMWVGTYQLTTIIENGNQFFSIQNGHVEGQSFFRLMPDTARFRFEIDTTAAQAMLMQAEATYEGIRLTWFQDDFDTLAGFNIYRSEQEHGLYTRINQYVLGIDETTLLDTSVQPGKMYYYNFTVVKTDLTESEPSGKVIVRAFDKMAPNIYHTRIYQAFTNSNLVISAIINDNIAVNSAKVYYRITGADTWKVLTMTNNNDKYTAVISSSDITLAGLEYYIEAFDGINYTRDGNAENPINTVVQLAVDSSAKGDVNGDGIVSTLDALMMLQAINGRLNLTAEQFLKADLDNSGNLSTWEVLKVLQYASGQISSLN